MPRNWTDTLAERDEGLHDGFIGAGETVEEFAAREDETIAFAEVPGLVDTTDPDAPEAQSGAMPLPSREPVKAARRPAKKAAKAKKAASAAKRR